MSINNKENNQVENCALCLNPMCSSKECVDKILKKYKFIK